MTGFDPDGPAAGLGWGHVGVLAAWTAVGLLLAAWTFRWDPRT